jgi:hypothetical protein
MTSLKPGLLECLDGVSVHPYRPGTHPPETAAEDFATEAASCYSTFTVASSTITLYL